jgi:predicted nucleotidyltransferase
MYKEALEKFQKEYPDYKVIFLHKSGSYLYGTQTQNSDIDYRGIFIPSKRDVLLKRDITQWNFSTTNESEKNKAGDLDLTLWSVYKFFGMLQTGDTNSFDTLFSVNSPSIEFCLPEMKLIYDNRYYFLPNSLKSFFGYAYTQVKKYSVKGDRLKDVENVLKFLNNTFPLDTLTLSMVQHNLPYSEKLKWVIDQDGIEYYEILGKKFVKNMKLAEFKERVLEIQNSFGARARAAMDSGSVDYKVM